MGRAYDQLSKVYTDERMGLVQRANFLPGAAAGSRQGSMGVDLKKSSCGSKHRNVVGFYYRFFRH